MPNAFKTFFKLFLNGRLLPVSCCETPTTEMRTNFAYPEAPRASQSVHFFSATSSFGIASLTGRRYPVEQKDGFPVNSCGSIAISSKIPTYEKQITLHYWRMHCGSGLFRAARRANNAEEIGLTFALSKCKRLTGSFAQQAKPAFQSLSRDGFRGRSKREDLHHCRQGEIACL